MDKKLNIVVGLKDNKQCRKLENRIRPILESMLTKEYELADLEVTYTKSYFDDSVAAGFANVGIMLEKFDNTPIGQGTIKAWSNLNPNIHLILVMDDAKKSSNKAHGLYKREYFNGLFLSDFLSDEMMRVILYGRTKEEAYEYYGMEEYYRNREFEEQQKQLNSEENILVEHTEELSLVNDNRDTSFSEISLNLESTVINKHVNTDYEELLIKPVGKGSVDIAKNPIEQMTDVTKDERTGESLDFSDTATSIISDDAMEKHVDTKISQFEIMALQDEEEVSVSRNGSVMNDNDWTRFSSVAKKNNTSKDIVKTNIKRGSSIKKVVSAISSLDPEDDFFKKIVDEADLFIHDNEQVMVPRLSDNKIVADMYKEVVDYYSYKNEVELNKALSLVDNETSMNSFQGTVQDYIDMINEQSYQVSEGDILGEVFYLFLRFILEYDILTDFIEDDSVTSIHVVDWNKIRIKKGTKRYSVNNAFINESYYKRFVSNLKIRNMKNSMSDHLSTYFTDRKVSDKFIINVSITNEFVSNTGRPEILIKKTRKERFTIKEMMGNKLSPAAAALLITAIRNGESILFVGPASCGATSLINTLLEYIPREKSGVVLQHKDEIASVEHPELIIQHPAIVRTKSEDNDNKEIEKVASFSILDIATSAKNLDVDYYVMVDVEGAEAAPFYEAFNAGFVTWANIKANSVTSGLQRLTDIIIASEPDLSREVVCRAIVSKFSVVVYMEKLRVVSISIVSPDSYDSVNHSFNVEEVIRINNSKKK